ncbi:unnamed protein product [Trichobilharzia regenti]|nr:unnamed protein product [Trichobilharzia regenti]
MDKKWTPSSSESKESTNTASAAGAALDLPKIRRNPLIEILPISTGCLNSCTYCKTKQARGVLASYPIEQLLDRPFASVIHPTNSYYLDVVVRLLYCNDPTSEIPLVGTNVPAGPTVKTEDKS